MDLKNPTRRRCLAAWLALPLAFAGSAAHAAEQAQQLQQAQPAGIKADYLYKFLSYVEWPPGSFAGPEAPHVVAVLGADDVLAELERLLAGHPAGPRRVVARRVAPDEPLSGVHVLHIGRGARPADGASLRAQALLVVTDTPGGMPPYAMLNFVTVERRVRFEASQAAAARAGLKLSARLLAVSERVVAP